MNEHLKKIGIGVSRWAIFSSSKLLLSHVRDDGVRPCRHVDCCHPLGSTVTVQLSSLFHQLVDGRLWGLRRP